MLPDWDDDSPQLRENLARLLEHVEADARQRTRPTLEAARLWQREIMLGLRVPDPKYVGAFRGEAGLEDVQVHVGGRWGVAAPNVVEALREFERRLQSAVAYLDDLVPPGTEPDSEQVGAILEVCAWAHAEWVRIHPFASGNGRTARLWANSLAMRYGLPPFVRMRPRPGDAYGIVSNMAMSGDWRPTVEVFRELLDDASRSP